MITFNARIDAYRPVWMESGGTKGGFNALVRKAMEAAGQLVVDEFIKRRFEASAPFRYGWKSRSYKTNQIKRYATFIVGTFGIGKGVRFPNPNQGQNPQPYVWTGQMRDRVLSDAANGVTRPRATATSNNVVVRVPVSYGHPIPAHLAGEFVRLNEEETRRLNQKAHGELLRLMREAGVTVNHNLAAA